ncbi:uncharacterized protein LOC126320774 [Schistocerca gregaria]|uniref:uncharacterized protein LOC126320774 n=1 Tax=Schistocerca gregaria TaxID=7010 RepID=UPI00211E18CC|nr:uncharacterized protein LOC126320774 [Schistocerca gregaria]
MHGEELVNALNKRSMEVGEWLLEVFRCSSGKKSAEVLMRSEEVLRILNELAMSENQEKDSRSLALLCLKQLAEHSKEARLRVLASVDLDRLKTILVQWEEERNGKSMDEWFLELGSEMSGTHEEAKEPTDLNRQNFVDDDPKRKSTVVFGRALPTLVLNLVAVCSEEPTCHKKLIKCGYVRFAIEAMNSRISLYNEGLQILANLTLSEVGAKTLIRNRVYQQVYDYLFAPDPLSPGIARWHPDGTEINSQTILLGKQLLHQLLTHHKAELRDPSWVSSIPKERFEQLLEFDFDKYTEPLFASFVLQNPSYVCCFLHYLVVMS